MTNYFDMNESFDGIMPDPKEAKKVLKKVRTITKKYTYKLENGLTIESDKTKEQVEKQYNTTVIYERLN
jgi:hypothetical protein